MRVAVLTALFGCAIAAAADSPADVFEKAPPHLETALRERLDKFMQAHIAGKFRLAEEVIHEDSKDIYYNSQKTKYIGYEVVKIAYSEKFTKAQVVTAVEMDWVTTRLGKIRVKPPLTTFWKQDDGQWWWYAIPQTEWKTPFGTMKPGEEASRSFPKGAVADVRQLHDLVQVDRTDIRLKSAEPSEETVTLRSAVEGSVVLQLDRAKLPAGLTVTFSKDTLQGGESATITFKYDPPDRTAKPFRTVEVTVTPIVKIIPFQITFSVPPELEKLLPKGQKP
ncbi:MAG TPA: hypothetical protein VES20_02210 [Bryobacteraceae bacterium]|nr:hypothetical protein [Bryobacteraceae bacterium]